MLYKLNDNKKHADGSLLILLKLNNSSQHQALSNFVMKPSNRDLRKVSVLTVDSDSKNNRGSPKS